MRANHPTVMMMCAVEADSAAGLSDADRMVIQSAAWRVRAAYYDMHPKFTDCYTDENCDSAEKCRELAARAEAKIPCFLAYRAAAQ